MHPSVLSAFGFDPCQSSLAPLGHGLINHTWRLVYGNDHFVLQRINTDVFPQPLHIAENTRLIGDFLAVHNPGYRFIRHLPTNTGSDYYFNGDDQSYYRLFPFVPGSSADNIARDPQIAYEAAKQFGLFSQLLSGFDATQLHIILPGFHDPVLRYGQFHAALALATATRLQLAREAIALAMDHSTIIAAYETLVHSGQMKKRVMHHDTKISNVLLDEAGKGLCVIDLDTVMPGYFISDLGDLLRTALSPVSEEERDITNICIRPDYYRAITRGYLETMGNELTTLEKENFVFAGQCMIYMQALRFLTDFLENDRYYGASYDLHNLHRATNQLVLLQKLSDTVPELSNL